MTTTSNSWVVGGALTSLFDIAAVGNWSNLWEGYECEGVVRCGIVSCIGDHFHMVARTQVILLWQLEWWAPPVHVGISYSRHPALQPCITTSWHF